MALALRLKPIGFLPFFFWLKPRCRYLKVHDLKVVAI